MKKLGCIMRIGIIGIIICDDVIRILDSSLEIRTLGWGILQSQAGTNCIATALDLIS